MSESILSSSFLMANITKCRDSAIRALDGDEDAREWLREGAGVEPFTDDVIRAMLADYNRVLGQPAYVTLRLVDLGFENPAGRYRHLGDASAEAFRDDHLIPALDASSVVEVDFTGVFATGTSWHEEVFGGLERLRPGLATSLRLRGCPIGEVASIARLINDEGDNVEKMKRLLGPVEQLDREHGRGEEG